MPSAEYLVVLPKPGRLENALTSRARPGQVILQAFIRAADKKAAGRAGLEIVRQRLADAARRVRWYPIVHQTFLQLLHRHVRFVPAPSHLMHKEAPVIMASRAASNADFREPFSLRRRHAKRRKVPPAAFGADEAMVL